jgi:hypothetical protein
MTASPYEFHDMNPRVADAVLRGVCVDQRAQQILRAAGKDVETVSQETYFQAAKLASREIYGDDRGIG